MRYTTVDDLRAKCEVDERTGCWLWTGPIAGGTGYGLTKNEGKTVSVHRLMFRLAHGEIVAGNDVCHRCDVRRCINPEHLWQGTRAENLADMHAKGRAVDVRGEKHPKAKLTESQVRDIRAAVASGETMVAIAGRYGLTPMSVWSIHHRRNWRHVQ